MDITGIDILGIDIVGVDILGIDIPAPTHNVVQLNVYYVVCDYEVHEQHIVS